MKARIRLFRVLIVGLVFLASASSFAKGGNSVGNGGGATALQFTATARKAVRLLMAMPLDAETKKQVLAIERAIKTTRVGSARIVMLDGLEVDALNQPLKKRIIVSRTGWQRLKTQTAATRIGFALHEYAWVSGLDDGDYSISDGLVLLLRSDRSSDDTQRENILARFAEIKRELQLAERSLLATPGQETKFDARTLCRLNGLILGAAMMFDTVDLTIPWPKSVDVNQARDQFKISTENFNQACAADPNESPTGREAGLQLIRGALQPLDAILR